MRSVLLAVKRDGDSELARALSPALRSVLSRALTSDPLAGDPLAGPQRVDAIVIPPSRREAYRTRGFRPLERVARYSGLHVESPFVVASDVKDQIGLDETQRLLNLDGAFLPRPTRPSRWHGRRVILLDDIVTSGATLSELERATAALGASVVGRIVLAVTPQRTRRNFPVIPPGLGVA